MLRFDLVELRRCCTLRRRLAATIIIIIIVARVESGQAAPSIIIIGGPLYRDSNNYHILYMPWITLRKKKHFF